MQMILGVASDCIHLSKDLKNEDNSKLANLLLVGQFITLFRQNKGHCFTSARPAQNG
jgi:hypothetical protein